MRTYLFLSAFWLLAALVVFGYAGTQRYTIFNTDWSIGWLLLLFAAWNGVRWWTTRSAANPKSEIRDPQQIQNPKSE